MKNSAKTQTRGLIRVEASSFREALEKIEERYGKDVSVVHTRVVRKKGMLGVLGGTGVEVYVTPRAHYEAWRGQGESARLAVEPPGPGPSLAALPSATPTPPSPSDPRILRVLKELQDQVQHLIRKGSQQKNDLP
ncbi:MAG: hypothetical protein V3T77_06040, partial [Planctomycetota bacterium]